MENKKIRCRKCRTVLVSESKNCLLDAHGEELLETVGSASESRCPSLKEHNCLYLSEESFPDFVLQVVQKSSWTKGKIYCPVCQSRLGSFNFISGSQCACGSHVLPQVHFLRSKVDWMKLGEVNPHPVSFPNHSITLFASTLPLDEPSLSLNSVQNDSRKVADPGDSKSLTDPHSVATTSQINCKASRSLRKDWVDVPERPDYKGRQRLKSRKKLSSLATPQPDEPSESFIRRQSSFEVLEDELATEDDQDDSEEDWKERNIPDNLVCPVCLDVLYSPLVTKPCGHVFCEPCLRRMAQPNPTNTCCPLCRQLIGQCMPCPELAIKVQNCFYNIYQKRRQFELQHNSQHLPLPWTRNFRMRNAFHTGENWLERAGGWRTIVIVMSLNILGIGIILYLGKIIKIQLYLSTV